MGYTSYYRFEKTSEKASDVEKKYQKAIKEIAETVIYAKHNVVNLAGVTSHTKVGQYGGISFNGVKEEGHDDFELREHFKQNEPFNFCKTAQKEYDIVVVAALIILKHRLGANVDVSSDGEWADWVEGLELAKKVTGLKSLKIPLHKPVVIESVELFPPVGIPPDHK